MNQQSHNEGNEVERKWKEVFTIVERDKGGNQRSFFVRVGIAFMNRDESWNVKLDAVPTNGTLHIRDPRPDEERHARRDDASGSPSRKGVS